MIITIAISMTIITTKVKITNNNNNESNRDNRSHKKHNNGNNCNRDNYNDDLPLLLDQEKSQKSICNKNSNNIAITLTMKTILIVISPTVPINGKTEIAMKREMKIK